MIHLDKIAYNAKETQSFPGLAILPLYWQEGDIETPVRTTLLEAMKTGSIEVREKQNSSVPHLSVYVKENEPVVGIKGTLLVGGGQDRHLTRSCILQQGTYEIPVQCIQHGRWNPHQEQKFSCNDTFTSSSLRFYQQSQQEVWDKIRKYETLTKTNSGSESLTCSLTMTIGTEAHRTDALQKYQVEQNEIMADVREKAQQLQQQLRDPATGQIGIIAVQLDPFTWHQHGKMKFNYFLEFAGSQSLWRKMHTNVISSLVYDVAVARLDTLFTVEIQEQELYHIEKLVHALRNREWTLSDSVGVENRWELEYSVISAEAICLSSSQIPTHLFASANFATSEN